MKLIEQNIKAKDVLKMIEARLEAVDMHYCYAVSNKETLKAEAYAETKWQLAELKMQFVDLLTEQLDKKLNE